MDNAPSPPRPSVALGRWGEAYAAAWLVGEGWRVLDRNWRCAAGEIDLVGLDPVGPALVFCEVKTRSSLAYGEPAAAVVGAKARRLRRLAAAWLADHPACHGTVRIDVVAVLRPAHGAVAVEHLRGVC